MSAVSNSLCTQTDPLLAFLNEWQRVDSDGDAVPDRETEAYYEAKLGPLDQGVMRGDIPNATTMEGAAAALRKVLSFDAMDDIDANLVKAALAFLEATR